MASIQITKGVGTTIDVDMPYRSDEENHAQRVAMVLDGDAKVIFNCIHATLEAILEEQKKINEKLNNILD